MHRFLTLALIVATICLSAQSRTEEVAVGSLTQEFMELAYKFNEASRKQMAYGRKSLAKACFESGNLAVEGIGRARSLSYPTLASVREERVKILRQSLSLLKETLAKCETVPI